MPLSNKQVIKIILKHVIGHWTEDAI